MLAWTFWACLGLEGCFGLWDCLVFFGLARICWALLGLLVLLGLLRLLQYHGLVFAGCACFGLLGLLWFSGLGCIDLQNVLSTLLCLRLTTSSRFGF